MRREENGHLKTFLMKIKVLSRSDQKYQAPQPGAVAPILRNRDTKLHPFQLEREYVRALNATKLQKVFAKPFLAALQGHNDTICSMAIHKHKLTIAASGSCNGELRLWNLSSRNTIWSSLAHSAWVRSISFSADDQHVITASDDKTIKFWSLSNYSTSPVRTLLSQHTIYGIDSNWNSSVYASCGGNGTVEIWNNEFSDPIHRFKWGDDTLTSVAFNPSEHDLIAATGYDRSITLMDLRQQSSIKKVVTEMRSNQVSWVSSEPMNFLAANEDSNVYLFDMRYLLRPQTIYKDHTAAVMSVSSCPTGKYFATGSYDRTIRLWSLSDPRSLDIYHTQRMQRVFSVAYTLDAGFVLSGSDDGDVRIWKARSTDSLKPLTAKEQASRDYSTALIKKFKDVPELSSIRRKRHVPKLIHKMRVQRHEQQQKVLRKRENVARHVAPDKVARVVSEKERKIKAVID
ncbi:hypothetical protein RCL1_005951 [Eukaryota sp. TZLM3-RCL]